jgi:hypothetical protein
MEIVSLTTIASATVDALVYIFVHHVRITSIVRNTGYDRTP